jgi:hypothetical protein
MAKTDSLQGSLDLLVLKILSRRPRLHDYAIMTAIADTSEDVPAGRGRFPLSRLPPDGRSRLDSK